MAGLMRIACVEDDPDIRSILELALADVGGYQVTLFCDGKAALEGIGEAAPQLVLLDMMMPGMNGLEVLERLKARNDETPPVIFMTAKAQPDEIEAYTAAGAAGVIVKPFDPMTLSGQVADIWERL